MKIYVSTIIEKESLKTNSLQIDLLLMSLLINIIKILYQMTIPFAVDSLYIII